MLVSAILKTKGDAVATIGPDATLDAAAAELARHGIGALVVSSDGSEILGIISERDVVRRLAASGAAALDLSVGEVMTSDVRTCAPDDTINEVMALMTDGRFRHAPVVDAGGAMIGIVSIGDVVKRRVSELVNEAEQLTEYISGTR